jgi:hypothetical protein
MHRDTSTLLHGKLRRHRSILLLFVCMIAGCASWEEIRQRNIETMFKASCGPQSDTPDYRSCVDDQLQTFEPE